MDCGMWNRSDQQDDGHPHAEDEEELANSRDAMGAGSLGEVPDQFAAKNESEEEIPERIERDFHSIASSLSNSLLAKLMHRAF